MPENGNRAPEWLSPWLKTRFYNKRDKCEIHERQYKTVFCGVCMGKPYCEICWKQHDSKRHKDHLPILHARRASYRTAIRLDKMRKLWDVSQIQVYKINNKDILHLNPNRLKSSDGENSDDELDPKCQTCPKKPEDSQYRFCSIACKYYTCLNGGMQTQTSVDMVIEPNVLTDIKPRPTLFVRRNRRKGVPKRAPSM